jgi:hypothetical protein
MDLEAANRKTWIDNMKATNKKYYMIHLVVLGMCRARRQEGLSEQPSPRYVCASDKPSLNVTWFDTFNVFFTDLIQKSTTGRCSSVNSIWELCDRCTVCARDKNFLHPREEPVCWSNGMTRCCPLSNPDFAQTTNFRTADVNTKDGQLVNFTASGRCRLSNVPEDSKTLCGYCWAHTRETIRSEDVKRFFNNVGTVLEENPTMKFAEE